MWGALIGVATAMPQILNLVTMAVKAFEKRPEDVVSKTHKLIDKVRNAETKEERLEAADDLSDLLD